MVSNSVKMCLGAFFGWFLLLMFAGYPAFGEDDTFMLVDGVGVVSNTTDYVLGSNGVNNVLIVTNAGHLLNAGSGRIGYELAGYSNRAYVTGDGSWWSNENTLSVGFYGPSNTLLVCQTGVVSCATAHVGYYGGADYNSIIVDQGILTNSVNMIIGSSGDHNKLIVSNAGVVYAGTDPRIGDSSANAGSNELWVAGAGSEFIARASLTMGRTSSGNLIAVSNGGFVQVGTLASGVTTIGANTAAASGNRILVTGAGSVYTNRELMIVGLHGWSNSVAVGNAGCMYAQLACVGQSGAWNSITISGAGSVFTGINDLIIGSNGMANSLVVTNGGGFYATDNIGVGFDGGSSNNFVIVAGAGSVLTNGAYFYLGYGGPSNTLSVSSGGLLETYRVSIGAAASAVNNLLDLTGSGSILRCDRVYVGDESANNRLLVGGGAMLSADRIYMGSDNANATSNSLLAEGAGTVVSGDVFYVGYDGGHSRFCVSNGAAVFSAEAYAGNQGGCENNAIILDGANTLWGAGDFVLGVGGGLNTADIRNGARLNSDVLIVGSDGNCGTNRLLVYGAGAMVSNSGPFGVGYFGRGNSVTVSNAGSLVASNFLMGVIADSTGNRLRVADAGSFVSDSAMIGHAAGSDDNEVLIETSGVWSNRNFMSVGGTGAWNRVIATNGGSVYSPGLVIGQHGLSTNNLVAVYNGSLTVPGLCNIIRGTNLLDSGVMRVGSLRLTNSAGIFSFNGGTLFVEELVVANGRAFMVGNGVTPATNMLVNGGQHVLLSPMIVGSNATLAGNGTIVGTVVFFEGGVLAPGSSCGAITVSNLNISGATYVYEKSDSTADHVNVTGTLTFNAGARPTIALVDAGDADFAGTNVLITYNALSGTPDFAIDYRATGLSGFYVTNNASAKQIELVGYPAPAAPTALAAGAVATNSFTAQWMASANATNYLLDVAMDAAFSTCVSGYDNHVAGDTTDVLVGGLTPDTTYYYRVRAQGLGGVSAHSVAITVSTDPLPTLPAPTGVTATKGAFTNKVRIVWVAVSNATAYEVYRNTSDSSASATKLIPDATTELFEDTAVVVGTTYHYWVKAKNNNGTSAFSDSDSGYALAAVVVPVAPTGVDASKGAFADRVRITWTPVANAATYEVWRNTTDDTAMAEKVGADTTATRMDDVSAMRGRVYYYWVKSRNAAGASGFSDSDWGYLTITLADPAMVVNGAWYFWLSGSGHHMVGPYDLGVAGTPVAGDFDGDSKADPAMVVNGVWYAWMSGSGHQMAGPYDLGVAGTPVAGDFDGDFKADPAMVVNGAWYFWLSGSGHQMVGPYDLGVAGTPVAGDFDGDFKADPAMVVNGAWYAWLSGSGHQMAGPYDFGMAGTPVAGDFDGDFKADPAMVVNGAWYAWMSGSGHQMAGPYDLGVAGTPVAGDFDGR